MSLISSDVEQHVDLVKVTRRSAVSKWPARYCEGSPRHYDDVIYNERDGISNHQPHDCLTNRLFRHRSKETSKLRVTSLCAGNSPVTGKFPVWNAENISIWWRHHALEDNIAYINHAVQSWWCRLLWGKGDWVIIWYKQRLIWFIVALL